MEVRGSTKKYMEVHIVGSLVYKKLTSGLPPIKYSGFSKIAI